MSQPSGMYTMTCRYCGQRYTRTNFMKRRGAGVGPDGKLLNDTHLIACARNKATEPSKEGE